MSLILLFFNFIYFASNGERCEIEATNEKRPNKLKSKRNDLENEFISSENLRGASGNFMNFLPNFN